MLSNVRKKNTDKLIKKQNREAAKENFEKRKEKQAELRRQLRDEGLAMPPQPVPASRRSSYSSVEEENEARIDAAVEHARIIKAKLPVLLKRLDKIKDIRQPKKIKYSLTVLMLYGILIFVHQFASRREANNEITRPMFERNLRLLFPELDSLPHADTLYRLLCNIDVNQIEQAHIDYVYVLEANLCFHNGMVIPLMSEFLDYQQGDSEQSKQDCEQKAFHRLAERIKEAFPRLSILLLLSNSP